MSSFDVVIKPRPLADAWSVKMHVLGTAARTIVERVGELPIRKDLRLLTEEGYSVNFYLRDSFGSVVILNPILDSSGNPLR